jgi:hypothetical protein
MKNRNIQTKNTTNQSCSNNFGHVLDSINRMIHELAIKMEKVNRLINKNILA